MSDSEVKRILGEIARRTGGKLWVAERIGKRISHLSGLKAGEELYIPHDILYDDGRFVVFGEGVEVNDWVLKMIERLVRILKRG